MNIIMKKTLLAILLASSFSLTGCKINPMPSSNKINHINEIKFAQFNAALAVDNDPTENYQRWIEFMAITPEKQNQLIEAWKNNTASNSDRVLAERVIQIRNIAAIIQKNRPDVLLLNEINNDGLGQDMQVLNGFQQNYLAVGQSLNSVDGGDVQEPISYPYVANYATNTGLATHLDLDNNGQNADGNDAQGFGFYHGHYAFALLSQYPIDKENTRTFQTFKRKDLPGAQNPIINICDGSKPMPNGMACHDTWFAPDEWDQIRLSSKNHVDAPIIIPTNSGFKKVHVLISHPTPSGFDTVSDNNKYRNSDENRFWDLYLKGEHSIYDDKGYFGGFGAEHFVVMGDLNADNIIGSQITSPFDGIVQLLKNEKINQSIAQIEGQFIPKSSGGAVSKNPANNWNPTHPYPEIRTSVFGSRADYVLPSSSLDVIDSGVYWKAEGEKGRLLFNDPRVGVNGNSKEISSDHRLVWATVVVK